ncbi:aspartyl-phosphate phosphatase Spo0E family protein [Neobacillus drentensis]
MSTEDVFKKIELIRRKMIEVGMEKGFTSPDTIKLSEILDKLITKIMNT